MSALPGALDQLLADWTVRYRRHDDRLRAANIVRGLFTHAGKSHPAQLTGTDLLRWINDQQHLTNNTLRSKTSMARTFLEWCVKQGACPYLDLSDELTTIRRSYPKTSGKVQDKQPAHRLTYDEAFGGLLDACKDGTWVGSRDQIAIRLGLLGIRVAEVTAMNWGYLRDDGKLAWIGKGRKPRTVQCGTTLLTLLAKWQRQYETELARPVRPGDPIVVGQAPHYKKTGHGLQWGHPLDYYGYRNLLTKRADIAGLGHVAAHDLRRTAAKILHSDKTSDGAHRFDIHDIQQVLGHARPDTTATYIADDDTDAIDRAAHRLD